MKTLLFTLSLALVLASSMMGSVCVGPACTGYTYLPPTVQTPSLTSAPAVTGGTSVGSAPTPATIGSGFELYGPVDVQASPNIQSTDTLTLEFSVSATFEPSTTTFYWIYSSLFDYIWSNNDPTAAYLDSVTSEVSITGGTCSGSCPDITTSVHPLPTIPFDSDTTLSDSNVSNYGLVSALWETPTSVELYSGNTYTLTHKTTFNISGLAHSEIIRIDLPETVVLSDSAVPEPATWAFALLGIALTGYRLRRYGR